MKTSTPVSIDFSTVSISLDDKITVLGSCFSDEIGGRLKAAGFKVCVNPFGPLYNPLSICKTAERLESGNPFTTDDCVQVGAGSGLICSHNHHTKAARESADEFLQDANKTLGQASSFWKESNKVIVTLGTAFVWKLVSDGSVVANCLKRPANEFTRTMMTVDEVAAALSAMIRSYPGKEFIFTISPIRHLGDGAHGNNLSKSTLLLGLDMALEGCGNACYFPSYEIVLDELRDYRYFTDDMTHPSSLAVSIIWEKFTESCIPEKDWKKIRENEKIFKQSVHRPMR